MLPLVALVALPDPIGFCGAVPEVPAALALPAEVGGELMLKLIEESRPKQTLSLDLGVKSPM